MRSPVFLFLNMDYNGMILLHTIHFLVSLYSTGKTSAKKSGAGGLRVQKKGRLDKE